MPMGQWGDLFAMGGNVIKTPFTGPVGSHSATGEEMLQHENPSLPNERVSF